VACVAAAISLGNSSGEMSLRMPQLAIGQGAAEAGGGRLETGMRPLFSHGNDPSRQWDFPAHASVFRDLQQKGPNRPVCPLAGPRLCAAQDSLPNWKHGAPHLS
jgi:hypothetical protein